MDRKEFLKTGTCICTALFLCKNGHAEEKPEEEEQNKTLEMKKKFVSDWTEHLMKVFDKNLDEGTRTTIMEACGRVCSERGFKPYIDMCKGNLEALNSLMNQQWA
ncbi:MAG: hypothetical protein KJ645_10350, partial [Planctomycetes bacterium]|nr:hypothetical protein [Planctomycetota bacterium]